MRHCLGNELEHCLGNELEHCLGNELEHCLGNELKHPKTSPGPSGTPPATSLVGTVQVYTNTGGGLGGGGGFGAGLVCRFGVTGRMLTIH